MAITKLRLEAEAPTLDEVVKDIEAACKAAKPPKELFIHDEHYERVGVMFRGRRVYGHGPKPQTPVPPAQRGSVPQFPYIATATTATSGTTNVVVK